MFLYVAVCGKQKVSGECCTRINCSLHLNAFQRLYYNSEQKEEELLRVYMCMKSQMR